MSPLRLKVGELARRTGLSVRTLHHYDELGLLHPSGRTGSGHRVYQEVEVRRLQKILSLKQLGLSLQEIQRVLDQEEQSLLDILERHRAHLSAENERVRTLLATLTRLTKQLRRAEDISVDAFLESIEQTIMVEKYYSPEQREYLAERAQQVGAERIEQVQEEWRVLFESLDSARQQGFAPNSEPVLELARRARDLIAEFTGGDAGVERSLGNMYQQEGGPKVLSQHGYNIDPATFEFLSQARAALDAIDD